MRAHAARAWWTRGCVGARCTDTHSLQLAKAFRGVYNIKTPAFIMFFCFFFASCDKNCQMSAHCSKVSQLRSSSVAFFVAMSNCVCSGGSPISPTARFADIQAKWQRGSGEPHSFFSSFFVHERGGKRERWTFSFGIVPTCTERRYDTHSRKNADPPPTLPPAHARTRCSPP